MKLIKLGLLMMTYCGAVHAQCVVASHYGAPYTIPCAGFVRAPNPAPISIAAFTPGNFGSTAAEIEANLLPGILSAFEHNPNLNEVISNAGPVVLARLSTELAAFDNPAVEYTHWILAYAIVRGVSVANLKLLHAAFGDVAMASVLHFMSAETLAAYNSPSPAVAPLPYSQMWVNHGGALPPYDLSQRYLYDLFLLQYFSSNDSPTVAANKATLYVQVRMHNTIAVIGIVLAVVATTIQVIEFVNGPSYEKISDWAYFSSINPAWDSGKSIRISDMPDLTESPGYGLLDPTMPEFPAIEGGGANSQEALFQYD